MRKNSKQVHQMALQNIGASNRAEKVMNIGTIIPKMVTKFEGKGNGHQDQQCRHSRSLGGGLLLTRSASTLVVNLGLNPNMTTRYIC
ncbi:hypothetical protein YC2023_017383 [Brassica napus]